MFFLINNITQALKKIPNSYIIQYFYRIYPTSAPHRTAPHRTQTLICKNAVTFKRDVLTHRTMQRYIEKYAVISIVTLNCNGEYTVTPTVTVITITAS